jgi:hypothetical protein
MEPDSAGILFAWSICSGVNRCCSQDISERSETERIVHLDDRTGIDGIGLYSFLLFQGMTKNFDIAKVKEAASFIYEAASFFC